MAVPIYSITAGNIYEVMLPAFWTPCIVSENLNQVLQTIWCQRAGCTFSFAMLKLLSFHSWSDIIVLSNLSALSSSPVIYLFPIVVSSGMLQSHLAWSPFYLPSPFFFSFENGDQVLQAPANFAFLYQQEWADCFPLATRLSFPPEYELPFSELAAMC